MVSAIPFANLLRTLSALLTICLLAQFFVAGVAAMTDPGLVEISQRLAIFQLLVIPLPILAWLGGLLVGGAHYSRAFPYSRSRCNMCWRTAQSKAALRLVWACTPWMPDYYC